MKGLLIISSCTIITEWHASQNVWSLRINMLVLLYISVKKMISNKGLFILQRDYTVYNVAYLSLRLVYWWIISLANTSLLKLTKLNLHFQLQGLGLCLFDILIFEPHTYIHSNCSWWLDFVKKKSWHHTLDTSPLINMNIFWEFDQIPFLTDSGHRCQVILRIIVGF